MSLARHLILKGGGIVKDPILDCVSKTDEKQLLSHYKINHLTIN